MKKSFLLWSAIYGFFLTDACGAARRTPTEPLALPQINASLVLNGETSTLPVNSFGLKEYISVEQAARLAQAQLRWQSVTQQACLSNPKGLLCFNWADSHILLNGSTLRKSYLYFHDNQLFVPLSFVVSKDFQNFSGTDIQWESSGSRLVQNHRVTLDLPVVEKQVDRYRLRFHVPPTASLQMLEQSADQIWLRFIRGRTEGSQILEGDQVVKEVRVTQRRSSADVVIKTGPDAGLSEVYFEDGRKSLVVDIMTRNAVASLPPPVPVVKPREIEKKSAEKPAKKAAPALTSAPVTKARKSHQKWTIVIDAGHGGMDSGAIGVRGTMEKDINLEVAEALAKTLRKEKDLDVILTRNDDRFLALNERTEIANKAQADLFVSIHCNSSLSAKHNGFEVFTLSLEATDKAAEAVARVENNVVALESKRPGQNGRLSELLASMAVYNFINESSQFAAFICRGMKSKTSLDQTSVKEADFYVLRDAQMPSLLVELEYLSHPVSELKLRSSRFRSQIVKGLQEGILNYARHVDSENKTIAAQYRQAVTKTER